MADAATNDAASAPGDGRVGRSRPELGTTDDGRPVREVLTYARRGGRLSDRQQRAWDRHRAAWWVDPETATGPGFTWASAFGRRAPLIVEIGAGAGEATVALAATRPAYDVLAFEVWRPGVADTLDRVAAAGLTNVRVCSLDAVWAVEHLMAEDALGELWTFFPDPWPKTRHHKRRLVSPQFASLAASRLAPGATWRLATDWAAYAERMVEVLDAEPRLAGGIVERWAERPLTRFERRGLAAGRAAVDLAYRRV